MFAFSDATSAPMRTIYSFILSRLELQKEGLNNIKKQNNLMKKKLMF